MKKQQLLADAKSSERTGYKLVYGGMDDAQYALAVARVFKGSTNGSAQ